MTAHAARAVREIGPGGVGRGWHAKCPCGWHVKATMREHAADLAERHRFENLTCVCYDAATMEYDPAGPCEKCAADEAATA